MKFFFTVRITVPLLLIPFLLLAQSEQRTFQGVPVRGFVIDHWGMNQGLPQNSVNSICQTWDGYLWLATYGGLVRFDGVQFTVFDRFNTPGMKADRCTGLYEDTQGRLWIGTESGLILYAGGTFKTYLSEDGLPSDLITKVIEDHRGVVWALTGGLPAYFRDDRFYTINPVRSGRGMEQMLLDNNSFLTWGKSRVFAIKGDSAFVVMEPKDFERLGGDLRDIIRDKEGAVWVALSPGGVLRFTPGRLKRFRTENGLASRYAHRLFLESNGDVWVATYEGISVISKDSVISITRADGLVDGQVNTITKDREGNIWVGMPTGGLHRLRRGLFKVLAKEQGLSTEAILSLCQRRDGSLLVGTSCGGMYEIWNGKVEFSALNRLTTNMCNWSVFEDSKGRIWLDASGLVLIERNKTKTFDTINERVFALYEDRKKRMWAGTANGLFYLAEEKGQQWKRIEGLSNNDVRALHEDSRGNLWVGTVAGLNKLAGDSIISFTAIPGLASHYFRSIHESEDGTLWFGSYGGGIVRLKNGRFSVITTREGLFDNIVSHIVEDQFGGFWIGCNRGIFRTSRRMLDDLADGKLQRITVQSFDKADGLRNVETNGGFQPNAIRIADGRILFPTIEGIAIVDPRDLQTNSLVPNVVIEKVYTRAGAFHPDSLPEIEHEDATLEIQYTALSFVNPQKVFFKHKLEGEDGWSETRTLRSAFYTSLSPGTHTFQVVARNNDGVWNEEGATVKLVILPPYWMTWWFRTGVALTILSISVLLVNLRFRSLKQKTIRQEEISQRLIETQEQERTRIAREMHDSLGQELLLVKNRAQMGAQSDDPKARRQFEQISSLVSAVLKSVRQISHDLRPPELDQLGLTETLRSLHESVRDSTTITVSEHLENIDGMFPKESEINVVRIVQEGLNNILKHSAATEVLSNISIQDGTVIILLHDNGKGFDVKGINKQQKAGLGLTNIRERVRILGGTFAIDSSPVKETAVEIHIPLSSSGSQGVNRR
ncbi:MAG: histidine kinase [Ignavibacteriae bacterium]|nr:histidine kinase [Ignavibacteriota bacterium]